MPAFLERKIGEFQNFKNKIVSYWVRISENGFQFLSRVHALYILRPSCILACPVPLTLARKRCFATFAHAGGLVRPPPRVRPLIELAPRNKNERVGRHETKRLVPFLRFCDVTWLMTSQKHEFWPKLSWLITFDLKEIQTWALHHRVPLVETRRMTYLLTLKGQFEIWPQVKVTWWPRGHGGGQDGYRWKRTDETNTLVPFILQSLHSIVSYYQKKCWPTLEACDVTVTSLTLTWRLPSVWHHLRPKYDVSLALALCKAVYIGFIVKISKISRKSAGGCSIYDVITPEPEVTSLSFLH